MIKVNTEALKSNEEVLKGAIEAINGDGNVLKIEGQ